MKLLIATDAWTPQVNGVVRTLQATIRELEARGHLAHVLAPQQFRSAPLPGYAEISLAWPNLTTISRLLREWRPDHVHIATEGPIGWGRRRVALREGCSFTTSFHTRFPEYLRARLPIPLGLSYRALRFFHGPAQGVMVATASIEAELTAWGFRNLMRWSRGVDLGLFDPKGAAFAYEGLARPISLFVGRLAPEKNLDAFLSLELPGSKMVIGHGPQEDELKQRYPDVHFMGAMSGTRLAAHIAASDVFVFPSKTDTFGIVQLEALASGVPVAAYPVTGPRDVIGDQPVGALHDDLRVACLKALSVPRASCRAHALRYSWANSAGQFLSNLRPIFGGEAAIDSPFQVPATAHPMR